MMRVNDSERGSSLILLLVIVATLAILASVIVVVLANAQSNTYQERTTAKSFHVAEAALDAAMANVAQTWPSAEPVPFPTATFQSQFKPIASATSTPLPEYPGPSGADFPDISVAYFDDSDTNHDGHIDSLDDAYDANGNDMVYIVAQARVQKRASRVQALVHRSYFDPIVPAADVLWCGQTMLNNSQGEPVVEKVGVENAGPYAGSVAADVVGPVEDYPSTINTSQITAAFAGHGTPRSLEQVYPSSTRAGVIQFAKIVGRYFDENNSQGMTPIEAARTSPANAFGGPGFNGLTVIRQTVPPPALLEIADGTQVNSESDPGVLYLLGGSDLQLAGTADFYGLMYVEGYVRVVGTGQIHGAVFVKGDADFRGTDNLLFNYLALTGITSKPWPAAVSMVPNTWRELRPQ